MTQALFLQKKGFNVTIFDRDNPGAQAASYGNAGHFSPYASVPLNRPDILAKASVVEPIATLPEPSTTIPLPALP